MIIRFDKVSYQYPHSERFALQNVDFSIRQGEFIGIIGPTGAGKTTLCLALNGIVPQFYGGRFFGHVSVAGKDSVETPVRNLARSVGEVFEDPETQLIATSVENEVAFPLENLGYARDVIAERVAWALQAVGLVGLEKKHPGSLSGGQKQRLAIAAAIAARPEVLVLDEPTSQLDSLGAREVLKTLVELNLNHGVTIVMASHAVEHIAALASRVFLLLDGSLVTQGPARDVFGQSKLLTREGLRLPETMEVFQLLSERGQFAEPLPISVLAGQTALRGWRLDETALATRLLDRGQTDDLEPWIDLRRVVFRYSDGTLALKDLDLEIKQEEYLLLAGQNGAGKTTLVKVLLNLVRAQAGKVMVAGDDIAATPVSTLARKIGYVGQNPDTQIFTASVGEEVAYALRYSGLDKSEIDRRVKAILAEVGLGDVYDRHPFSLPKGDRARVVIAAVLALEPGVIVFDEPTVGQDYAGAIRILDLTKKLNQSGKTVIVITHHLYLMREYAQRMVVLNEGAVVLDGSLRDVLSDTVSLRRFGLEPPETVMLAESVRGERDGRDWPILPGELADYLVPPDSRTA